MRAAAAGSNRSLADLRFGIRHFARTPFSTLTMIVVLALGIGFNTALFVFVYSFVNSPPPGMARQESLVRIRGIDRAGRVTTIGREFSYPEYREYAVSEGPVQRRGGVDLLGCRSGCRRAGGGSSESLHSGAATYVTANYFQVLGVHPIMGAGLPADAATTTAQPQLVAVISHVVWDRYFGRAPDVVGRTLKVNDVPVTIVGVAPRRFAGARTGGSQVRVWLPLGARPFVQRTPPLP